MLRKASTSLFSIFLLMVVFLFASTLNVYAQEEDLYLEEDNWEITTDDTWDESWDDSTWEDTAWDDSSTVDDGAAAAFFAAYFGFIACISLVGYVYQSLTLMTIGKKLGEEPAWLAWVPVANLYYMVKVSGLNPWLFLLFFIPLANFFLLIYVWMKIAERRGFQSWLGILLIVPFVNVFIPAYLAWFEPSGGSSSSSSDGDNVEEAVTLEELEASKSETPAAPAAQPTTGGSETPDEENTEN